MRTKKFGKKLALKKTTVADLSNLEMRDVRGGGDTHRYCPDTEYPCYTCDDCSMNPSCQTIVFSCSPDWTHTCM